MAFPGPRQGYIHIYDLAQNVKTNCVAPKSFKAHDGVIACIAINRTVSRLK